MEAIQRLESSVRGYVRSFPTTFATAEANWMSDVSGRRYLDFLSGAGALNYGHNHPVMREALQEYLLGGGIAHGLDMATVAKREFLETFEALVLQPRHLEYRVQFPGPTGTNAVEAALKLARKVKQRSGILHFTRGFHGMTLGAIAVTGNGEVRQSAGVELSATDAMPFDGYFADGQRPEEHLEHLLDDPFSGIDQPAAAIVETVQGEGGVHVASDRWLQALERVCRERDILLIVDDIQAGVGRTGPFFSFESAGIKPDIVTLAKSISGMGLPMALVLIRPDLDIWAAGEHTGTFRGNNHAFVTARAALETFWSSDELSRRVDLHGQHIRQRLEQIVDDADGFEAQVRGRGMFNGLDCRIPDHGSAIAGACFDRGMIIETTGEKDKVLKVLPPLISPLEDLNYGLDILAEAIQSATAC
ncbi:MAG: diaminobutyrate--2-oxoglutarate transaminase [Salinisphaeraceae bacterium]|nr:diaminobutyrate--2-oxoglutarate transaminase [Salinisphaeraceae bacterium]